MKFQSMQMHIMAYLKSRGYWVYSVCPENQTDFAWINTLIQTPELINCICAEPGISLLSLTVTFPDFIEMQLSVKDYELPTFLVFRCEVGMNTSYTFSGYLLFYFKNVSKRSKVSVKHRLFSLVFYELFFSF